MAAESQAAVDPSDDPINRFINGKTCIVQDGHGGVGFVGIGFDPLVEVLHGLDELRIRRVPPAGPALQPILQDAILTDQSQILDLSEVPALDAFLVSIRYEGSTENHRPATLTDAFRDTKAMLPETSVILSRIIEMRPPEQVAFNEDALGCLLGEFEADHRLSHATRPGDDKQRQLDEAMSVVTVWTYGKRALRFNGLLGRIDTAVWTDIEHGRSFPLTSAKPYQ